MSFKAKDKYKAKGLPASSPTSRPARSRMVSRPTSTPQSARGPRSRARNNRLTTGVYDGLDLQGADAGDGAGSGKATLNTMYDARNAPRLVSFTTQLWPRTSLPEVFALSECRRGAIALAQGVEAHKAFLRKMGQLDRLRTELPESASPIAVLRWSELNTTTTPSVTASVAPLQAVMGINAVMNGGYLIPPIFLGCWKKQPGRWRKSDQVRNFREDALSDGSTPRLELRKWPTRKGYYIGGKTGTSKSIVNGRYSGETGAEPAYRDCSRQIRSSRCW